MCKNELTFTEVKTILRVGPKLFRTFPKLAEVKFYESETPTFEIIEKSKEEYKEEVKVWLFKHFLNRGYKIEDLLNIR